MLEQYLKHILDLGYSPKTIKGKRHMLCAYAGYIYCNFNKRIESAGEEEIKAYAQYLLTKNINVNTYSIVISTITAFYNYLEKKGYILYNPISNIEIKNKRELLPKHVPDEETIAYFLNRPDEHTYHGIRDKAILELLYSTGIRRGEVMKAKLSDIDLSEGLLTIREGKGNKFRIVPVGKIAVDCIALYLKVTRPKYLKRLEEDSLFITERGESLEGNRVNEIFRKYREKSKLTQKISPHSMRHACALHMLRGGAAIEMVQKILGHASINSTQIYTRLYPKDLKEEHRNCHPREKNNCQTPPKI